MNELGSGQRTGAETYTAERKDDDFQQLRLAALERLDAPKGVPTIMLPGIAPAAGCDELTLFQYLTRPDTEILLQKILKVQRTLASGQLRPTNSAGTLANLLCKKPWPQRTRTTTVSSVLSSKEWKSEFSVWP